MEDTLISLRTAILAKEKGFNIETFYSYKQPVVTIRGTKIKEKRHYTIHETNTYNSVGEISYPNEDYFAPTQSLLQKWLRDVYNIHVVPFHDFGNIAYNVDINFIKDKNWKHIIPTKGMGKLTYEEALEEGLYEALNFIKI